MTKLVWHETGQRFYSDGVDRGVFYPSTGPGVAWNGLVSVEETPSGTSSVTKYFDGESYQIASTNEEYAAQLEAFTYPKEFEEYDGFLENIREQKRRSFNFCYRTLLGDDEHGLSRGYQIHLVYNALASPNDRAHNSLNASVDVAPFTWDISTTPVVAPYSKPAAHFIIDTTTAYPITIELIEDILYGSDQEDARFPTIDELIEIFESNAIFIVTDHGDGTFTVSGPDEAVHLVDPITFELNWPSVILFGTDTYQASSL